MVSTDLNAAREKARAMFTALDGTPTPRWRVVDGGGESLTGIAPECPRQADADGPHALTEGRQDTDGMYRCCPEPWLETYMPPLAEYLVALLNEDAASGGEVR